MFLYRVNEVFRPALKRYWRLSLQGPPGAVPSEGPLLIAANHTSFIDPWLIGMALPRRVRFLIDQDWYESSRAWNALFRHFGAVPVARGNPAATLERVCAILLRGEAVGIFPEGGISTDGKLRRFRAGIAHMAAASGAPVLPLGVRGAFESLPRHRFFPRPVRVTVHAGHPMVVEGAPLLEPSPALIEAFMARLRGEILRLAGQAAELER